MRALLLAAACGGCTGTIAGYLAARLTCRHKKPDWTSGADRLLTPDDAAQADAAARYWASATGAPDYAERLVANNLRLGLQLGVRPRRWRS